MGGVIPPQLLGVILDSSEFRAPFRIEFELAEVVPNSVLDVVCRLFVAAAILIRWARF
jgi:hypothetical protein